MPDLENVVKSLEICLTNSTCNDCWYFNNAQYGECHGNMMRDALALLKAQMPVEVTFDFDGDAICGYCGAVLDKGYDKCPKCGMRVKWHE